MSNIRAGSTSRARRSGFTFVIAAAIVVCALPFACHSLRIQHGKVDDAFRLLLSEPGRLSTPGGGQPDASDDAEGAASNNITVFDSSAPTVANLNPNLRNALRRASIDAAMSGVTIYISSGWRSPEHQQQLFDQAVKKYGSKKQAARWVATVSTSSHVAGDAADVGHASAITWLSEHGAKYGLCEIYRNEPWHYELRPAAAAHGCPPQYADPTRDPRMQP
ncbi:M15 family metallopeptidase [Pseudomonas aeruginosa]|uniref:M15 family metallopeptidase n=1 Tax=Pseudomonas aeruginosa TaxID=287 RepID=UPI00259CC5F7|nr:M15 family metallopeptidase [Pseudomonas aeruginosa]MDM4790297.1 M15 family metallopeptidase [Pseudomonas aeruginosa]MDM4792628.1 M15 family metallopeptidase [Pseudomonas aeruginosa]MDM4835742.1 M15 family metallopeptidase [Pseudomonas aeruginosa]MDM4851419.1 M15 family metallopeptidase [Pseudomonas aeruginosa]MDM5014649.1 M15 family metallopeptidase [Pseudomonas aeruginosa]